MASSLEQPARSLRVLVTRPSGQSERFADRLRAAHLEPVVVPVTALRPVRDGQGVRDALRALDGASWLAVTSPTAVATLADAGFDRSMWQALGCPRLAVVGTSTAAAIEALGVPVAVMPDTFDGHSLADALGPRAAGQTVVIAQAANARLALRNSLRRHGADVRWFGIYDSHDRPEALAELRDALTAGLDWTTATSSEIARATVRAAGDLADPLRALPVASIGPLTTATLTELGFSRIHEASTHTSEGLIELLRSRSHTDLIDKPDQGR